LGVEVWKIGRVLEWGRIKVFRGLSLPVPRMAFRASYKAAGTQELDDKAVRYLSFLAAPLLLSYAVWSFYYGDPTTNKTPYTWLLSTLVGFVYTFGFIMMTPQLFINYHLQSVAHLPWRVFVYKALNTFIDDLFAFIIKMPTMHRLACFRDDLVFLVYLYQRWAYRVDRTRANEYGQTFADEVCVEKASFESNSTAIEDAKPDEPVLTGKRRRRGKAI